MAKKLIYLDPGHGADENGHGDPGAVAGGLIEERIVSDDGANLGLCQRLAHHLRERGYTVRMTRGEDEFVPLEQRGPMAVRDHADLFVSCHINAGGGEGLEVWIHPRAQRDESKLAALILQKCLQRPEMTGVKSRGIKKQRWRVLSDCVDHMPCVLIETMFIDNAEDRKHLADRHFREAWSLGVADAIDAFFGHRAL